MMDRDEHPSFLALDRWAARAQPQGEIAQHLESCDRCRAHVVALGEPLTPPRWAYQRSSRSPGWLFAGTRARWRTPLWAGSACAALALVGLIVTRGVTPQPEPDTDYVGTRGAAAVGLYVKRGERVFLWDGQQRIRAGDRLRIKVVPDGFTQVGVFTLPAPDSEPVPLLVGPLAGRDEVLLPAAWTVDAEADAEILFVVLARGRTPAELQAYAAGQPAPADVWTRRFVLEKAGADQTSQHEGED